MGDDTSFRASMLDEDLQQDRRMIMKKIQQRRRHQILQSKVGKERKEGEDADGLRGESELHLNATDGEAEEEDGFQDEDDPIYLRNSSFDEELLRDVQEAHQQDEQLLGGRIEDGQEEGLDAMNQALTSPPTQWWAMRKQWQKRRGSVMSMMGGLVPPGGSAALDYESMAEMDASYQSSHPDGGIDSSNRSGYSAVSSGMRRAGGAVMSSATDAGVVGHPVMLEDPASIGYSAASFRQNPNALADRKRREPTVVFVTRGVLQKRRNQQAMYVIAAMCVVFLFMFFLEQRKLSHYAMIESPISWSTYMAGEQIMAESDPGENNGEKVTLGDLGLKEFDKVDGIPEVEFGNAQVEPGGDPVTIEELANDPLVGDQAPPPSKTDFALVHGNDRLELLKGVLVGWGVTPAIAFDNPNSPQFLALSWMTHEDVLRYSPENEHWIRKIVQRYALAVIYYSTGGPGWEKTLFFLSNYDECDWNREDDAGHFQGAGHCEDGFITALALWTNNLKGALPPETGALFSLRTLSVFDNNIDMAPPKSLIRLESLERLYVQGNNFRVKIDYLCEMKEKSLKIFRSACGKVGGVTCSCCTECGRTTSADRGAMLNW